MKNEESKQDFIHKLAVSWKESRESWYWLRLIQRSEMIKPTRIGKLLLEADELSRILGASLETARKKKP